MPKLRYNPKTGKMEPAPIMQYDMQSGQEVPVTGPEQYGKNQFSAQMPIQAPSPYIDEAQAIQTGQQARSLGTPNVANNYAMQSTVDHFMDKIKQMLASSTPDVTNTEEFQKMMPEAYSGNQNMKDLQSSYQQRYNDYNIQKARPGYSDEQVAAYQQQIQSQPVTTEQQGGGNYVEPVLPQTEEVDTMPYANPNVDPRREFAGQTAPVAVNAAPLADLGSKTQVTNKQVDYTPQNNLANTYRQAKSGNLIEYTDPETGEVGAVPWGNLLDNWFKNRYSQENKF